jgi:type I restriction-modification system DNA methylase subunit
MPIVSRLCIPHIEFVTKSPESQPKTKARDRAGQLSKDGKWRSFPRVPNLLQYVSTKTYYARVKQKGKVIRRSLRTNSWTTARLRLVAFLKDKQEKADIIRKSYEYLIRKFAEGGGQSAGEFYTPPEVATIMSRVLQPEPGSEPDGPLEIYDPCCGSGGPPNQNANRSAAEV